MCRNAIVLAASGDAKVSGVILLICVFMQFNTYLFN